MQLSGKVIVITGNSSGIGQFLFDRWKTSNTVIGLSRSGTENTIRCDLADPVQIDRAAKEIADKYGKVDVLVNNAGYGITSACETLTDDEIFRMIDVNLSAAMLLTKRILPLMGEGGKIINISSACALFPLPYRTLYSSVKAGLHAYSMGLAMELSDVGISVTSVCPGDIKTPFTVNRESNYTDNPRYGDKVRKADEKVAARHEKRMDCAKASARIAKICEKRKPKPFYIVGAKYKVLYLLKRLFPTSWFVAAAKKWANG